MLYCESRNLETKIKPPQPTPVYQTGIGMRLTDAATSDKTYGSVLAVILSQLRIHFKGFRMCCCKLTSGGSYSVLNAFLRLNKSSDQSICLNRKLALCRTGFSAFAVKLILLEYLDKLIPVFKFLCSLCTCKTAKTTCE